MSIFQALSSGQTYQGLRKTSLAVGGSLCTVGGFVADVLQPIAPFAFYLFLLSLAGLVIVLLLYLRGKKELLGSVVLAGIAGIVFGLLSLLQLGGESQEEGILASTVPAIASLQQSLGIIDQKLDGIKLDTESIKATTARLESNSESMLVSLDAIREGLGNGGGIIANADSPEEHYHNARVYELGGDYAAARRSYLEYFKGDLPILDPHLRFISFLKVQEGTAGARETYNAVTAKGSGRMPAYARLLLLNAGPRIEGLKAYWRENPDFSPAAYHLSLEYSETRLGSQTLSDKRQELAYIQSFQESDEKGGLLRYMVDQELVEDWREDAESRRLALQHGLTGNLLENPVSLSWMSHNAGWNGNIQISEPAQDIKWNIKGETQPASTGGSGYTDPSTGRPAPRTFFSLAKNQKSSMIEIRYTDLSGAEQGPFEFTFQPQGESDKGNRRVLEMTSTAWLSFRDYEGKTLLYFTHLLSYRGALSKIEYGVDRAVPDQSFTFSAWDQPGLAPIDGSSPAFLKVPGATSYVTAQLTYKNGDQTQVIRFDRM